MNTIAPNLPDATLEQEFDLDAGAFCLDFVNTLTERYKPDSKESLHEYSGLVRFVQASGQIDAEAARALIDAATAHPRLARAAFERALTLREGLFRIFSAVAHGGRAQGPDLDLLSQTLAEAAAASRIVAEDEYFHLAFTSDTALDQPRWLLARAAADLLLSDDLDRVRQCAADDCAWMFLDTSRNRSRRWCSMSSCGNRAKVQHFRARKRETA